MIKVEDYYRGAGDTATRDAEASEFGQLGMGERRRAAPSFLLLLLFGGLLTACSSDDEAATDAAGDPADANLGDALAAADSAAACPNALCGRVTYAGAYTGPEATIHIRVYKETDSASDHSTAAVGDPDFFASRAGPGDYQVAVDGYEGNLYVSAFMDVDASGQEGGPTGSAAATDGLHSDPMGAYGGYTFAGTADTEPTPIAFTAAGVTGIDVALSDSGVITGAIYAGSGGSGATVIGAFVPVANGKFLHHLHGPEFSDGMVYFLAIPPADHWRIRANVGSGSVGFYPNNPPPAPPANASPVSVTANHVTPAIDMTLGGP